MSLTLAIISLRMSNHAVHVKYIQLLNLFKLKKKKRSTTEAETSGDSQGQRGLQAGRKRCGGQSP